MAYTPSEFKDYILKNRKDFIALSKAQEKELGRLYIRFAEYAKAEADKIVNKEGLTYAVKKKLISDLLVEAAELTDDFKILLDKSLIESANLGKEATEAIMKRYQQRLAGIGVNIDFSALTYKIPDDVLKLAYSRILEDGLKLSDRIWTLNKRTRGELERIILEEIATGRPASSKVLEARLNSLLNPDRRFVRTSLHGRNVSFDAARLLRSERAIAFREADRMAALSNPGNVGIKWILSTRPCAKCIDISQADDFGLGSGVYPVEQVPTNPHPQCMCTTYEITLSSSQFVNNWIEWMRDKSTHPKLNQWYDTYYKKVA